MLSRITQLMTLPILAVVASAGTVEYNVTVIPPVPGSWNWVVQGMNNNGEVVGWAQYSGDPFFMRGWKWSEAEGMTLLPAPPGSDALRYAARDINDAGVITGDGGGDGGVAWRLQDGVYTILGTIEGDPLSTAPGINQHGDIAGYSGDPSFGRPKHLFRYSDEGGMVSLLSGRGTAINDSRQVVGYFEGTFGGGWQAVRIDADGQVLFLGVLPGYNDSFGFGVNNAGQVVGTSRRNESSTAFIYSDVAGLQPLPTISRWNAATAINSRGHVVGSGTDPGVGFVWTPETGTRSLRSLIDPALQISIRAAADINDCGQIAAYGSDLVSGGWVQLLLTPVEQCVAGDLDGDGDVDLADLAMMLSSFGSCDGDAAYNATADIDNSACVELVDLAMLLANFGT